MDEFTVGVSGMTCDHCVKTVAGAVTALPGVEHADVDLDSGEVAIVGENIDKAAVREAIVDAGYEPTG
jgi:copper chaperone CopZ